MKLLPFISADVYFNDRSRGRPKRFRDSSDSGTISSDANDILTTAFESAILGLPIFVNPFMADPFDVESLGIDLSRFQVDERGPQGFFARLPKRGRTVAPTIVFRAKAVSILPEEIPSSSSRKGTLLPTEMKLEFDRNAVLPEERNRSVFGFVMKLWNYDEDEDYFYFDVPFGNRFLSAHQGNPEALFLYLLDQFQVGNSDDVINSNSITDLSIEIVENETIKERKSITYGLYKIPYEEPYHIRLFRQQLKNKNGSLVYDEKTKLIPNAGFAYVNITEDGMTATGENVPFWMKLMMANGPTDEPLVPDLMFGARSNHSQYAGLRYLEVTVNEWVPGTFIGFNKYSVPNSDWIRGSDCFGIVLTENSIRKFQDSEIGDPLYSFSDQDKAGTVFGFLVDLHLSDTANVWVTVNGQNVSGNYASPDVKTSLYRTGYEEKNKKINFVCAVKNLGSVTVNFGSSPFAYPIPDFYLHYLAESLSPMGVTLEHLMTMKSLYEQKLTLILGLGRLWTNFGTSWDDAVLKFSGVGRGNEFFNIYTDHYYVQESGMETFNQYMLDMYDRHLPSWFDKKYNEYSPDSFRKNRIHLDDTFPSDNFEGIFNFGSSFRDMLTDKTYVEFQYTVYGDSSLQWDEETQTNVIKKFVYDNSSVVRFGLTTSPNRNGLDYLISVNVTKTQDQEQDADSATRLVSFAIDPFKRKGWVAVDRVWLSGNPETETSPYFDFGEPQLLDDGSYLPIDLWFGINATLKYKYSHNFDINSTDRTIIDPFFVPKGFSVVEFGEIPAT